MTKESSIWKKKNIAPITKIGVEGLIAATSLFTSIATVLVATNTVAWFTFLASFTSPAGIAALFVSAIYFTVAAYTSYQQIHKNEKINGGDIVKSQAAMFVSEDVVNNTKIADQVTKTISETLAKNSNVVRESSVVSTFLDELSENAEQLASVKSVTVGGENKN